MKKQRKIVFWAASLLLTGALAAGGTLAYLTDKDSVTNQFVVGKVDIEGRVTAVCKSSRKEQAIEKKGG